MPTTRRDFLKTAGTAAAAGAAIATSTFERRARAAAGASANERCRIAVIGPGGQGLKVTRTLLETKQCDIAWVCDVDDKRIEGALEGIAEVIEGAATPKTTKDMRRVFDDKDVDAVVIGLPDHWHAPATILACDAGKHVYVEKPASHNLREGRLMIDAARRNKVVVQVGTQSRSNQFLIEGIKRLREGAIGEVLIAKAWNSQLRPNIGRKPTSEPPAGLDYDSWVGPAPFTPYSANKLHGTWRWFHDYGTGDIGNDGVHDIDIARWGLGVDTHPSYVAYVGGQLVLTDTDQQWPDTYYVAYDYPQPGGKKKQLIYEQRTWCPYDQEHSNNGGCFYGTKGMMQMSKRWGWKIYGAGNLEKESMKASGVGIMPHVENFLACIKDGKAPAADIEIGHLSSSLSHLGNIASRTGRSFAFDPAKEQVIGDDDAQKYVRREYREHWGTPKGA